MKRVPHTADFRIDGTEFEPYREITRFGKRESNKATDAGDDSRARAISFLMSLYQRRLASSTFALRRLLENRARRLEDALKGAQDVVKSLPTDFAIPDADEMEEMEDVDRERLEDQLAAVSIARNAEQVREEIEELKIFAKRASSNSHRDRTVWPQ